MDNKIFIPSKRFGYILGVVLLIVLVISLADFPISMFSLSGASQEAIFKIGWPVVFFELDLFNIETMPIRWVAFILSLFGYFIFSYCLDVLVSFLLIKIKGPEKYESVMVQARKAYFYYKNQGMEESAIHDLFKQKGWKEEDIAKLK